MARILSFCFGLAAYAIFLGTFLYAIGFVAGVAVPKGIDSGEVVPTIEAVIVDILLLSLFALQHSLMARKTFKQWWTKYVPTAIERILGEGRAGLARRRTGRKHSLSPSSRRATPPICSDLIYDRDT